MAFHKSEKKINILKSNIKTLFILVCFLLFILFPYFINKETSDKAVKGRRKAEEEE